MLLTLQDIASQQTNKGELAPLFDPISELCPVLGDTGVEESNDGQGHSYSEVTGLPTAYYRLIGDGYPESKSSKKLVRNTAAICGGRFEIDRKEARMFAQGEAAYMAQEEALFMQSIIEKIESLIFYGNSNTDLDAFMGIHIRLSVPSASRSEAGYNIINGGGSGSDNTSIVGIVHGPKTFHGFYPKGSKAGMTIDRWNDFPLTGVTSGTELTGHKRLMEQEFGIAVPSWRGIARICNVDVSDLTWDASGSSANLRNLLSRLVMRLKTGQAMGGGKPVIYCNDTIYSFLDQQCQAVGSTALGYKEIDGKEVMQWRGVPIKIAHKLLNTEATVTGTFSTV